MMANLRRGTKVEICPFRARGKTTYDYAMYDGCSGEMYDLTGHGEQMKARVKVVSSNKNLAGGIDVPVKALKPL